MPPQPATNALTLTLTLTPNPNPNPTPNPNPNRTPNQVRTRRGEAPLHWAAKSDGARAVRALAG